MSSIFNAINLRRVILVSFITSLLVNIFFLYKDFTLYYYDSIARLNIARKTIDNLTPGLGQLGVLWLPLPHILNVPFIWNDWIWHTGLSGTIISSLSFLISIMFAYKMIFLLFKDHIASFLSALVLLLNINILYIQSTPMSEMFFIMTILGSMYYFINWIFTNNFLHLIFLAFFVFLSTLTRYEGYFIFLNSILLVILISKVKKTSINKIEGTTILFITLSSLGILLWFSYQALIFKDPFYWLKVYTKSISIISVEDENRQYIPITNEEISSSLFFGIIRYFNAVVQINGVLFVCFIIILGFFSFIYFKKLNFYQKLSLFALFFPIAVFMFTALALKGGFPLEAPHFSFLSFFDTNNYIFKEYNIRYGLNFIPFFVFLVGILSSFNKYYKILILILLITQMIGSNTNVFYLQYNIPKYLFLINYSKNHPKNASYIKWFREHYDGGYIMISALKHEPTMFYMNLPYKVFIHEGTKKYWKESIQNPQTYARWIFMYKPGITEGREEDSTTKFLKNNDNLYIFFEKKYEDEEIEIYKKKDMITKVNIN
ncbi:MAG: hypothetical protein QXO21_04940 [Candidatus Anstonellales archaeon]